MQSPGGPTSIDEYSHWNEQQLKRRKITRRAVIAGLAVGAGSIGALPAARLSFERAGGRLAPCGVVVTGRHLSFVSDAGGDPSTGMRVTAQLVPPAGTLPRSLTAVVEIGAAPGLYDHQVPAEIVHLLGLYAIPSGPAGSQYYVKAELAGLAPGTRHHYRIRLSDGTATGDAFFTTAPPRELAGSARTSARPFTFTALADIGTNRPPTDPGPTSTARTWPGGVFDNSYAADDPVAGPGGGDPTPAATLSRAVGAGGPAFTLVAGDICYADLSGNGLPASNAGLLGRGTPAGVDAYDPYVWDVFFRQIESAAAYTPWMFATGNHDMEALYGLTRPGRGDLHGYGGHEKRLDLPRNGPPGCPSVYTFTYANVGVLVVDGNDFSSQIQTNLGYSDGEQRAFVKQTLRRWRKGRSEATGIDFVVVVLHQCLFSAAASNGSDGGLRSALEPLFSHYQVDLVVQGHNHVFERTDPMRDARPTRRAPDGSTVYPATDGVTYVTVGSGGRERHRFDAARADARPGGQRYRNSPGGADSEEPRSNFFWSTEDSAIGSRGYRRGARVRERVSWSQTRYDGYAYLAVDVSPAPSGQPTTMTLRALADSLPRSREPLVEIDRVTLSRVAGHSGLTVR